jgi:hypothetical protein
VGRFCHHLSAHPDLVQRLEEMQREERALRARYLMQQQQQQQPEEEEEEEEGGDAGMHYGAKSVSSSTQGSGGRGDAEAFASTVLSINCSRARTKKLLVNIVLDEDYS